MVGHAGKEVWAGEVYTLFGKGASFIEHVPGFEFAGGFKIIGGPGLPALNESSLQRGDGERRFALTGASFGDLFEPRRILVGEAVKLLVVDNGFVVVLQFLIELRASGVEVDAIGPDGNGLGV